MQKIPCLFARDFSDKRRPILLDQVTPGCEWVFDKATRATYKWDGTACLVRFGMLYKRHDCKRGKDGDYKVAPPGWEPIEKPDTVTGHWPGWLLVDRQKPEDKYHVATWFSLDLPPTGGLCEGVWLPPDAATQRAVSNILPDGTYELVGPKINGNPHKLAAHAFAKHGERLVLSIPVDADIAFEGLRQVLEKHDGEGIVFHGAEGQMAKIRRADYDFPWPLKGA